MSSIALQWLTARLTDNDPFHLGLLYFFNFIPLLLLSPWAGVIADKHERTRIVSLSQAGISVFSGCFVAYLAIAGNGIELPFVYAYAFGTGALLAVSAPSSQAITANTVPAEDLASAIGLQSASLNVARVAGPGLATPLLLTIGPAPVFAVYAATSLFTAWAVWKLKLAPTPRLVGRERTWRRVAAGVAHIRSRPPGFLALAMVASTSVLASAYVSQLSVFAAGIGGGDIVFGTLIVATGLGAVAGAIVSGSRSSLPRISDSAIQMIAMSALLVVMAATGSYLALMALAAAIAFLNFSIMTSLNMVVQTVVDEANRGRVMSLYILAWGGLIPVGSLLLGSLATTWGMVTATSALGTVQLVIASTILFYEKFPRNGQRHPAVGRIVAHTSDSAPMAASASAQK